MSGQRPTLEAKFAGFTDGGGKLELSDGSRVAVIGGGPAGSFFSYFLLDLAERIDLKVEVDLYEPRDFTVPGPMSCNMCGGIISESLVQMLATEGINLPTSVVQRGIDSYVLHMDVGDVSIATPENEKRIGALHRGAGPRGLKEIRWDSFDGHLQKLAAERGVRIVQERVEALEWVDGRPVITGKDGTPVVYDLVAIATGVNSNALKFLQTMGGAYQPPTTTKTFIREYFFGEERINQYLGSSMHVFLLPLKGLEFAALIPKGDCATLCLLGEEIDRDLVQNFMQAPQVARCFPPEFDIEKGACQCSPRITLDPATEPFRDRMLFVGDCGVTRLYKDGIGAAYRTAKAAANAVVFHGVAAEDLRAHYYPTLRGITKDNNIGKFVFWVTGFIQKLRFTRRGILRMVQAEQAGPAAKRRMSTVLWDTFTGSSPYREILQRSLTPAFLARLAWSTLWPFGGTKTG